MKLLSIGCGAICKSFFEHLYMRRLAGKRRLVNIEKLTIIDPVLKKEEWHETITTWVGVQPSILNIELGRNNVDYELVSLLLDEHNLVMDLRDGVNSLAIIELCRLKNVNYINTSVCERSMLVRSKSRL